MFTVDISSSQWRIVWLLLGADVKCNAQCMCVRVFCLLFILRHSGRWLWFRHRGHCWHPYCGVSPTALWCGCYLLLPQQVWLTHVHCCQLLWQVWAYHQGQGCWGGQSCLYVSTLSLFMRLLFCSSALRSSSLLSFYCSPSSAGIIISISAHQRPVTSLGSAHLTPWMRMKGIMADCWTAKRSTMEENYIPL